MNMEAVAYQQAFSRLMDLEMARSAIEAGYPEEYVARFLSEMTRDDALYREAAQGVECAYCDSPQGHERITCSQCGAPLGKRRGK
jgi:hypothetical protein